ncbi:MAG: glycoside hydrolase family 43 protein [Mangrovibacterium sp.]
MTSTQSKLFCTLLFLSTISCGQRDSKPEVTETERAKNRNSLHVNNPIIRDKYTADPSVLVHNDTVYLYAGHDEAPARSEFYKMDEWLVYSSTDLVNWTEHSSPLKPSDFEWAAHSAWASDVVERDDKFYWYATVEHGSIPGKSIGVAVSDSPTGPFKDAIGAALISNDMTTEHTQIMWDDIDPIVFIDNNKQAYIYWGNTVCYWAKLKDNMIELDGEIHTIDLPHYTEAPYIHKRGEWYYLSYAYQFPEKTAYAMSKSIEGPWEHVGILNELAGNSNTNHQAIVEYQKNWYYIYHTGALQPDGGSYRRSVCIDRLYYNSDSTLQRILMTSEGIQ